MSFKKWMMRAGLACLCLGAAGCGQKEAPVPVVIATPTPEISTPTPEPTPKGELVEMATVPSEEKEKEKETFKNVAGEKKEGSESVQVVNQTGEAIRSFYIRLHPEEDDEDWGEELIKGAFVLGSKDVMLAYYQGQGKEREQSALYDLRIFWNDEDESEFYFRNIPLQTISRITLLMDGKGEDAIPYAKYVDKKGKKEYSTLDEVKRRLGLLDEDEDDDEDEEVQEEEPEEEELEEMTPTEEEAPVVAEAAEEATPTPEPEEEEEIDIGTIEGDSFEVTDDMTTAMGYVGSSLDALEGALGGANGSDYVEEPEMGMTGYHYYGSFTVSTTVAADGSEIVTGVW
ncbi:MAG: hypothetical protein IIZ39_05620 [Blautia sp.]|nr:hypothetical protein [Blautia sp.]